jgi:hypothetical protein
MKSGILDRSRLAANVLMVVLVAMNIYFSIQYTEGVRADSEAAIAEAAKQEERLKIGSVMKLFVDTVLGTNGVISFEDRIKLENDIRGLNDAEVKEVWERFTGESATSEEAQDNAVLLMSVLSSKISS